MKNQIVLERVERSKGDICLHCLVRGDQAWVSAFCASSFTMNVHYTQDVSGVPAGIAAIPLVANVLPIVWLFDAELIVDELDAAFFDSIPDFKRGFECMYPQIPLRGAVSPRALVRNEHPHEGAAVLFSGGVDSFDTLIANLDQRPELITVWGADIAFDNESGWQPVRALAEKAAEQFGLPLYIIHTNLRQLVRENYLTCALHAKYPGSDWSWWRDFHHSLFLFGHAAPIACRNGIGRLYIASTFTAADAGLYTCASDPTIDNFVRFGSVRVEHHGYEYDRQQKIRNLCTFAERENTAIEPHVCWESKDGHNCGACKKCYLTIMSILAEGKDPTQMGFPDYSPQVRRNMMRYLRRFNYAKYRTRWYPCVQARLRETYTPQTCPRDLRWFYRLRFAEHKPRLLCLYLQFEEDCTRKARRLKGAIKRRLKRIGRKTKELQRHAK